MRVHRCSSSRFLVLSHRSHYMSPSFPRVDTSLQGDICLSKIINTDCNTWTWCNHHRASLLGVSFLVRNPSRSHARHRHLHSPLGMQVRLDHCFSRTYMMSLDTYKQEGWRLSLFLRVLRSSADSRCSMKVSTRTCQVLIILDCIVHIVKLVTNDEIL